MFYCFRTEKNKIWVVVFFCCNWAGNGGQNQNDLLHGSGVEEFHVLGKGY